MAYANRDYYLWNQRYERLKAIRETICNQPKPDFSQPQSKGQHMNIETCFPSKFLKSSDLMGKRVKALISGVTIEEMGDGSSKPCLHFAGKEKMLALNVTNANALKDAWGSETDGWKNREVELYAVTTQFKGQTTQGLRLSPILDREPGADAEPDF
jgi:hypothetical protein